MHVYITLSLLPLISVSDYSPPLAGEAASPVVPEVPSDYGTRHALGQAINGGIPERRLGCKSMSHVNKYKRKRTYQDDDQAHNNHCKIIVIIDNQTNRPSCIVETSFSYGCKQQPVMKTKFRSNGYCFFTPTRSESDVRHKQY